MLARDVKFYGFQILIFLCCNRKGRDGTRKERNHFIGQHRATISRTIASYSYFSIRVFLDDLCVDTYSRSLGHAVRCGVRIRIPGLNHLIHLGQFLVRGRRWPEERQDRHMMTESPFDRFFLITIWKRVVLYTHRHEFSHSNFRHSVRRKLEFCTKNRIFSWPHFNAFFALQHTLEPLIKDSWLSGIAFYPGTWYTVL